MKPFLLFSCLLLSSLLFSQISTTQMNGIKVNQTQEEVEKLIGQKLKLDTLDSSWVSTTKINKDGIDFELLFFKIYMDDGKTTTNTLFTISTTSTKIKTLSKIGVGSNLDELFAAYKNYDISIWRNWDDQTDTYSKTERIFQLLDYDQGTAIYFYLKDNKVYKIETTIYEGC